MNEKVSDIEELDSGYRLEADKTTIKADVPVMAVGAASLRFAHQMGYKNHWILLPVAGNFVCAPRLVNGKVYMMQLDDIPFAAVHADPQVDNLNETQFGPVAKILPMLERGNYSTVSDFFKLAKPRWDAFASLLSIGLQPVYLQYMLQQILYDIPYIGRLGFLKQARKIIPTLSYSDLEEKKRHGGIRPQIIDTNKRALKMGEAKIVGDDIIFDITPSPGASVSLANAKKNAKQITAFLGSSVDFDEDEFMADHEYNN
jgi:L-2-hydroxyglutarate oxidase LhgO